MSSPRAFRYHYAALPSVSALLLVRVFCESQTSSTGAFDSLPCKCRSHALQGGMVLMREDGQRLVDAGTTNAAELLRVTRD